MTHANRRTNRPSRTTKQDEFIRQDINFRQHKTAEEIAADQGFEPITDLDKLIGRREDLWASEEELDRFLEDIRKRRREGKAQ